MACATGRLNKPPCIDRPLRFGESVRILNRLHYQLGTYKPVFKNIGKSNSKYCVLSSLVVAVILLLLTLVWADEILTTLDDLPFVLPRRTAPFEGLSFVRYINQDLRGKTIIANGFAARKHMYRYSVPALNAFVKGGDHGGNHSWSHADYGLLGAKEFCNAVKTPTGFFNIGPVKEGFFRFRI